MRAHFGIGDATMIDSIVIEWPSGIRQYRTGVLPDQILDIEEDIVNAVPDEPHTFNLNVFPNPTSSDIRIEANFRDYLGDMVMEVYGDTGQIVYRAEYTQVGGLWQSNLDLKKLQLIPGQYMIRVSNGVSGEERKVIFIR